MNCPKCHKELNDDYNLCPYCGLKLIKKNTNVQFNIENGGINNRFVGAVAGDNYFVETIKVNDEKNQQNVEYYQREVGVSLIFRGDLKKGQKISAVLGILSAIITIYQFIILQFINRSSSESSFLMIITIIILACSVIYYGTASELSRKGKTYPNAVGECKVVNKDGRVAKFITEGKCTQCETGVLILKKFELDGQTKIYGFCSDFPRDHVYSYNAKKLNGTIIGPEELRAINDIKDRSATQKR